MVPTAQDIESALHTARQWRDLKAKNKDNTDPIYPTGAMIVLAEALTSLTARNAALEMVSGFEERHSNACL